MTAPCRIRAWAIIRITEISYSGCRGVFVDVRHMDHGTEEQPNCSESNSMPNRMRYRYLTPIRFAGSCKWVLAVKRLTER